MKNIKGLFIGLFILFLSMGVMAQTDPPDPPGTHGSDQDQQGHAPIVGGIFILLSLGAAYGGKKIIDFRRAKEEVLSPLV